MAKIFGSIDGAWQSVIDRVQGDESPASCSLMNGNFVFDPKPIPYGADRDLKFLAEVLRSEVPIPSMARAWLADIFDPNVNSTFKVEPAKGGRRKAGISHHWEVAQYALLRMECGDRADDPNARDDRGDTWPEAVKAAMAKFKLKKSAVEKALKSYRDAFEVHAQLQHHDQPESDSQHD